MLIIPKKKYFKNSIVDIIKNEKKNIIKLNNDQYDHSTIILLNDIKKEYPLI